ncbi:hypothetical protein HY492_03175 [Candidatus Woesearchaeota archaeon]|nr:hypothetical protein [Candidatus Woesearchaeota archaeon]
MKRALLLFLLLLVIPNVSAAEAHVKLLALLEEDGNSTGILADLSLQTQPGSGRVFLDTFPLTKIATQVSLRLAQQVACTELDKDCSGTDFFYAIQASPGIVGGPSAGSSAAVLAAALISDRKLNESVAMTGTINSGGLIGPVGGTKDKLAAAAKGGITKVLIPAGTSVYKDGGETTDLIALGATLGVEVVEVATLDEALAHFTNTRVVRDERPFVMDPAYKATMQKVADELCGEEPLTSRAENFTSIADTYAAQGEYYSAASYCFRANLENTEYQLQGIMIDEFQERVAAELKATFALNAEEQPLTTITDLQTYMLVKERIGEAQEALERLAKENSVTPENTRELAYAIERLNSARAWGTFFGTPGRKATFTNESLRRSCEEKLGEAEERYNYVQTVYPDGLQQTRKTLNYAEEQAKTGQYIICLHEAAKAKSEADSVLSVLGVEENRTDEIISVKLAATQRALVRAQAKQIFPIIGYSYYEYAKALQSEDKYSALLFAEYANELSTLDVYFAESKPSLRIPLLSDLLLVFGGIALGWILASLFQPKKRKR